MIFTQGLYAILRILYSLKREGRIIEQPENIMYLIKYVFSPKAWSLYFVHSHNKDLVGLISLSFSQAMNNTH